MGRHNIETYFAFLALFEGHSNGRDADDLRRHGAHVTLMCQEEYLSTKIATPFNTVTHT